MKLYIIFSLCFCLNMSMFAQQKQQQKSNNPLIEIENKILADQNDVQAIDLINAHRAAKDEVYSFRLDAINSYAESMTVAEKNKQFRKDYINDEEYQLLKDQEKEAFKEKMKYIRANIPAAANGIKKGKTVRKPN